MKRVTWWVYMHVLCMIHAERADDHVKFAVIVPNDNSHLFSHDKVYPVLDLAVDSIKSRNILPNVNISLYFGDSKCTSKDAPIEAFNFYMNNQVSVFLGPVCDYSLAPVARYAPFWSLPVLSPGGFAHDFGQNKRKKGAEYPTLTRTGATFNSLAMSIITMTRKHGWDRIKVIYDGNGHSTVTPKFCFLAASAFVYYSKSFKMDYDFYIYIPKVNDIDTMLREEIGNLYSGLCHYGHDKYMYYYYYYYYYCYDYYYYYYYYYSCSYLHQDVFDYGGYYQYYCYYHNTNYNYYYYCF